MAPAMVGCGLRFGALPQIVTSTLVFSRPSDAVTPLLWRSAAFDAQTATLSVFSWARERPPSQCFVLLDVTLLPWDGLLGCVAPEAREVVGRGQRFDSLAACVFSWPSDTLAVARRGFQRANGNPLGV